MERFGLEGDPKKTRGAIPFIEESHQQQSLDDLIRSERRAKMRGQLRTEHKNVNQIKEQIEKIKARGERFQ